MTWNIFSSFVLSIVIQGLKVAMVYYFQIWNKKNETLLLVELSAVTGVLCILRYLICYRPASWNCKKSLLHFCRGARSSPTNKCLACDTKQSDGEAIVPDLWVMWCTPSLPLLSGPLQPRVVVPFRVPSMDQIEILNVFLNFLIFCVQTNC